MVEHRNALLAAGWNFYLMMCVCVQETVLFVDNPLGMQGISDHARPKGHFPTPHAQSRVAKQFSIAMIGRLPRMPDDD